jgi:TatA/E family protein of Tat protein translocase
MFALILETLSSTELLFILVIALIFFGPRKLPQLAHSIGKSLAEFRKASEDFKRTWEREVATETARLESTANSILEMEPTSANINARLPVETPVEPAHADLVVPRTASVQDSTDQTDSASGVDDPITHPESRKHEWL